jgi:predicted ATPase
MTEPIFVGCERELARLESLLGQALAGRGQVAFVCGEAGSGKTALVSAFTAVAMRQSEEMIVAVGGCSAQGRVADPYLPFREVLATLAGAAGEHGPQPQSAGRLGRLLVHSAQVLVEVGPDLIGTLIPGSTLLAKIGKVAIQKAGWMDQLERLVQKKRDPLGAAQVAMEQGRILEQYANVLKAMAAEHPLLLVIEDLHWADEASLGLFFHLSRRIETSRILLIGTYRPDEIEAAGDERHPLQKVLAEVKRYAGDVWVDWARPPSRRKRPSSSGSWTASPTGSATISASRCTGTPAATPYLRSNSCGVCESAASCCKTLRAAGRWGPRWTGTPCPPGWKG